MFRRKEDSLFDNNDSGTSGTDTATMVAPPASSSASSSERASSPSSRASSEPRESRESREPRSESRERAPSTPPTSSAFRTSSAPIGGEITRGRMPEAKAPVASVSMDKSGKSARRVLTVGNDILLKGEIATCDRLVIEGKVDATLNEVHTVEIAETGSFKGAAHIEDAEISGLFEGDLIVRNRLIIYSTGKVRGKISYGEIEIERGGELTGEIKATTSGAQPSSRPGRKEDKFAA